MLTEEQKDGRAAFLDIDTYQRGQGSEEQCATNAWDELMQTKLTPNSPGGVEQFLAQWEDIMSKLRDIKEAPSPFLELTLFKKNIKDPEYKETLRAIDVQQPPLPIDSVKMKIREVGAKIESDRKEHAIRSAKFTHQAYHYGPHYDDYHYTSSGWLWREMKQMTQTQTYWGL